MADRLQALTEKEKQTLRLVVRGYDAKSMARHLGLSVHTVNERLRDARRKLQVSSSREAGRMLQDREHPQSLGDKPIGGAASAAAPQVTAVPGKTVRWRTGPVLGGVLAMTLIAALALSALSAVPSANPAGVATDAAAPAAQVESAARAWLAMIDRADWAGSYAGTGRAFHQANTLATWQSVSERVRAPLGAVLSRQPLSTDFVPTPQGYWLVKFRTRFAGAAGAGPRDAVETVSLGREGGAWKVVGVVLDD